MSVFDVQNNKAMRVALRLLKLAAFGYLVYAAMLFFVQRDMIFPGADRPATAALAPPAAAEQWWLETPEGRVEAWFFAAPGASEKAPKPAVIFAHGNGGLVGLQDSLVRHYRQMGLSVLLPEYRGYGRSAGTPSEAGIVADFAAFYDRLAARPEVDSTRIVFHGYSLGGAVVASLARERRPAALILQSTFTRLADFAASFLAPALLLRDDFDTMEVLDELDVPVLVVHGRADGTIPYPMGEALAAQAAQAELLSHDGGHGPVPDAQRFWRAVRALLETAQIPHTPK